MLNPIWLDTFITLAETGSFTRTSEARFMTQPGVSQHIKRLEEACGCDLVVRLGKGIQLTEQGQRVLAYAKGQKEKELAFITSLKFDVPFEGKCVIGCSGAIAQRIYPALLSVQLRHPALHIHVEVAPRQRILASIADNTLSLGIVTNEAESDEVICSYLGEETLGLILPRKDGNDTQEQNSARTIDKRIASLGLINHPDAMHYLHRYINDSGDPHLRSLNPMKIKTSGYINQLSQILIPVSRGLGFTVLPTSTLAFVNVADKLDIYEPKNNVTEPLYSVQTPHNALPARYQIVKETIAEVLR
ncbi:LysR family transcriptional regulator [Alteromonas sp.]|nr:LysR family transcriptional regulator [Alteromonas sp.]